MPIHANGRAALPGRCSMPCTDTRMPILQSSSYGPITASWYTGKEFNSAIKSLGLGHGYVRYKTPQQDGHLESFHAKLKMECVWPADPESFQGAGKITLGAFAGYNTRRLHSSIGYVTPAEFAAKWRDEHK